MEQVAELTKIIRGIAEKHQEIIEGTFQVEKRNKGSVRLRKLDESIEPITVKMTPKQLEYVQEGMILIA